MNLFCLLGIHKKEFEIETVLETESFQTYNHRLKCKHCNWKTEWEGSTTFSLKFYVKDKE